MEQADIRDKIYGDLHKISSWGLQEMIHFRKKVLRWCNTRTTQCLGDPLELIDRLECELEELEAELARRII
jgi:hypothetical protein